MVSAVILSSLPGGSLAARRRGLKYPVLPPAPSLSPASFSLATVGCKAALSASTAFALPAAAHSSSSGLAACDTLAATSHSAGETPDGGDTGKRFSADCCPDTSTKGGRSSKPSEKGGKSPRSNSA